MRSGNAQGRFVRHPLTWVTYALVGYFAYLETVLGPLMPFLRAEHGDRKSTRLNSSHANISYAVFCLKKKIALEPPRALAALARTSRLPTGSTALVQIA